MDPRAFGALALLAIAGAAVPRSYDQRQDGRVNVQIDVKDVQILALLDSDTIDDYVVGRGPRASEVTGFRAEESLREPPFSELRLPL
jgi:hypothetical protein